MRRVFLMLASLLLLFPVGLLAESSDCNHPTDIVPDGRTLQGWFPASTAHYFRFKGQAGHSYNIELVFPYENQEMSFVSHKWFSPTDNFCSTGSLSVTDVTFWAPWASVNGSGWRVSFIASTLGTYGFTFTNSSTAGYYTYRVVDTTLFSPRWSTWGSFLTQWGFNNSSDHTVTGVFTIYNTTGTAIKTVNNVSVPVGMVKFYSSVAGDLNLPTNTAGNVMFAFIGPPGVIQADAAIMTSTSTVIFPVKFEAQNSQH